MELVWDNHHGVLRDGGWIVDQHVCTERLFGAAKEKTAKTLFLVVRLLKRLRSFCLFPIFFCPACPFVFSHPVH